MRKSILLLACLFSVVIAHGQIVDADGLNARKTQMFGSKSWKSIATEIATHLSLDDRKAINYVKVIDLPNNTESQLFEKAKRWANNTFNTSECMVRSIDDSNHSIIVQGYVNNAVEHIGGSNIYYINLRPIVRIQVKNEKARVTFTMPAYNVHKEEKSGSLFRPNSHSEEIWDISKCYPFDRYSDLHEITSAKALVMTHLCATRYMEIIEGVLRSQLLPNDNNDW